MQSYRVIDGKMDRRTEML